ncbi:MAG: M28 family peptidase [Acidobacteriota bacterium]
MLSLAIAVLAAAPAVEGRVFWKPEPNGRLHPAQSRVTADAVAEGRHVVVFRDRGYHLGTNSAEERRQVTAVVDAFDRLIFPRQVALAGPCPDRDGNDKVIVLLTALPGGGARFFRFDQLPEDDAVRNGFHSNAGEVLYLDLSLRGNRSPGNLAALAGSFHELLHHARDPRETSWSELLGGYTAFELGLAPARALWGDADPTGHPRLPSEPWNERGWSLLFARYLHQRLGDEGLSDLIANPKEGLAGLDTVLGRPAEAVLADFAATCWIDDPELEEGRLALRSLDPPRPAPLVRLTASRPTSGQASIGVGGFAQLIVTVGPERPLPLALRGHPGGRWAGVALVVRRGGPDEATRLDFDETGLARLDLSALRAGDSAVVSVTVRPADDAGLDRRRLPLQWGLGWVPETPPNRGQEETMELLRRQIPDGGAAASTRLLATIDRLTGGASTAAPTPDVATRYAWSPAAEDVVAVLRAEIASRGLDSRVQTFVRRGGSDVQQTWSNVLIDLPGDDPRRWPVVVAAHWDGARSRLDDSYLRALNLDDNATGVAVSLEIAAALSRTPRRGPVIVALLAGGHHGAAGARAMLEHLQGRVAAWVELDEVGIPLEYPRHLAVRLEGASRLEPFAATLHQALARAGLAPRTVPETASRHTVLQLPGSMTFPAVVVRLGDDSPDDADLDLPPAAERPDLSPEVMLLLARGLAAGVGQLAGAGR